MENKYYTPKIEEFHVGFEYEKLYRNIKEQWWVDSIWKPNDSVHNFFNLQVPRAYKIPESIRVKYLDKEDIESLGWVYDKTSTNGELKFVKDNIMLYYRPKTKELGTFTLDPSKSDFFSKYSVDNKQVKFLIIKNKSELKVLLKQLNINL